ncbi:MAG: serine protease [Lachnospiraceae bacterium]|nr:serine protease [Lachnospiraceae bacterium]
MLFNPKKFVSDVIESVKDKKDFVHTEEYINNILEKFVNEYNDALEFISRYIEEYVDGIPEEEKYIKYAIYQAFDNILIEGLVTMALADGCFDFNEAFIIDELEANSNPESDIISLFNGDSDTAYSWIDIFDDFSMVSKVLDNYVKSEFRDINRGLFFEALFNNHLVSNKEKDLILDYIIDRIVTIGFIFSNADGKSDESEKKEFLNYLDELVKCADQEYYSVNEERFKDFIPPNTLKMHYYEKSLEKYGKDRTKGFKLCDSFEEFYDSESKIVINKNSPNCIKYDKNKKDYIDSIPYIEVYGEKYSSCGSGVIITEDGYGLSCSHVFKEGVESYVKIGKENNVYRIEKVFLLKETDLAIFKLEKGKYNFIMLDISYDEPEVGEKIRCLGFPIGGVLSDDILKLRCSMTEGVISSVQTSRMIKTINLDIAARHGNSGGPIILSDSKKVIGLLHGAQPGEDLDEINFSHPIYYLNEYLEVELGEDEDITIHETDDTKTDKKPDIQNDKEVNNKNIPNNPYEELKKLKELLDLEIITKDEFDEKKKKLMDMI